MKLREILARQALAWGTLAGMGAGMVLHWRTVATFVESGALPRLLVEVWPPTERAFARLRDRVQARRGWIRCVGCGKFPQRRDGQIDHLCHLAHYIGHEDGWNDYQLRIRRTN
jgi:hypothetical protein